MKNSERLQYEVWKEGRFWKVKMPHGIETYTTKRLAVEGAEAWKKANCLLPDAPEPEEGTIELKKGDIIQITNDDDKWFPCLLIVDEVKNWGVQGYISIPLQGAAYYRIKHEGFKKVGTAEFDVY